MEERIQSYVELSGFGSNVDKYTAITNSFKTYFGPDELDQFGMPKNDVDLDKMKEKKERYLRDLSDIFHECKMNTSEESNGDPDALPAEFRVTRLMAHVDNQYELIFRWMNIMEDPAVVPDTFDGSFFRLVTIGVGSDDLTPYQKLTLYMLDSLQREKYTRYKGSCCKEILTPEKKPTRAWETIMELKEFVYSHLQKETKYDMWQNSTAKAGNISECIKFLSVCKDIQFPEIKKDRNVWSFRNGIYNGRIDKFYKYGSEDDVPVVSCKYFDLDFLECPPDDWYQIPTPYFQSILDYQKFDEDVCRWFYVFAGRLCFELNTIDCWQVIPFLKGIAGSGKSTLITKALKKFYETEDVKTLSNNMEKKFGLSSIHDCLMFIGPEVKGDLALEQAEFQSMVSGEDISIAVKNEKAITKEWRTPGILAGNEVPNWKDNSGSIQRRIVTWNFTKQVLNADPKLEDKLEMELACILQKCVKAYLEYTSLYGNQDVWNVLPNYFKEMRKKIASTTNSLVHFLGSEKIVYGRSPTSGMLLFVPQKVFVNLFMSHCQENNLVRPRGFNEDTYAAPFSSRDIEVRTETVMYNGVHYCSQPVIYGLDIVSTLEAQI
jgi:hypothetical protein